MNNTLFDYSNRKQFINHIYPEKNAQNHWSIAKIKAFYRKFAKQRFEYEYNFFWTSRQNGLSIWTTSFVPRKFMIPKTATSRTHAGKAGSTVRKKKNISHVFCKEMWFNVIYWNKTRSKSLQILTRKTIEIRYRHRIRFSWQNLRDKPHNRYLFMQLIGALLDHKFTLKSIQVLELYSSTSSEYSFIRIVYLYSP